MDTIFIIESRYKGETEDLYDCYVHKTYMGALKHKKELADEYIDGHDGKMPEDMFEDEDVTEIDYSDFTNDMLILEIKKVEVGD